MDYAAHLRQAALAYPGAWEDHPWGDDPAYKNGRGKIFVFAAADGAEPFSATVKLAPGEAEEALSLPFVSVARYVGRYGWVTVRVDGPFEFEVLLGWVGRSYELVERPPRRR